MPDRVVLLIVLVAGAALFAVFASVKGRLGSSSAAASKRLIVAGGLAIAVLELIFLVLLASTGDHFDGRCMQPQTVCGKSQ